MIFPYRLRVSILKDDGTWVDSAYTTGVTNAVHALEIDWQGATAPGTNNGTLTFWLDDVQKAALTGIDNDTRRVDWVQLGCADSTVANASGTAYFDDFVSRRSTKIGLSAFGPTTNDLIFSDSFESGDFSAWWSATTDGGNLSVSTASALDGTKGIQALINDNTSIFVSDTRPYNETHYRAHFHFGPNTITMANGNAHYLLQAFDRGTTVVARVELKCTATPCTSNYKIAAQAANDSTGWTTATYYLITDAPHTIEIDWKAATASGANNGVMTLWIDGVQKQTTTNVDKDTRKVNSLQLGGVSGIDTGTRGTEYIDGFISRRSTYIGFVPSSGMQLARRESGGGGVLAKQILPGEESASTPAGIEVVTIDYTYDRLNRLTAADYSDGRFFHYKYDAVGNRLSETTPAGTTCYYYDVANRLVEVYDNGQNLTCQPAGSVSGVMYTWDNNGNLLSDGEYTYVYDHANRLKSVTNGTDFNASYSYNGLGDRVSQTVNSVTTNFTLDMNSGLTQVLQEGSNSYLYGTQRLAQYQGTNPSYFLGDALGSVRQLVDASGAVTLSKGYEPYGEELSTSGGAASRYGYTGEQMDETGLVYLRARMYSSVTGRFQSRDPWRGDDNLPVSYNKWLYAGSNPIKFVDPSGLWWCEGKNDCEKWVEDALIRLEGSGETGKKLVMFFNDYDNDIISKYVWDCEKKLPKVY
jgi:RHS repeat-associated protein